MHRLDDFTFAQPAGDPLLEESGNFAASVSLTAGMMAVVLSARGSRSLETVKWRRDQMLAASVEMIDTLYQLKKVHSNHAKRRRQGWSRLSSSILPSAEALPCFGPWLLHVSSIPLRTWPPGDTRAHGRVPTC